MPPEPDRQTRIEQLVAEGQARATAKTLQQAEMDEAARKVPAERMPARRSPDVIAKLLGERGFWSLTPAAQLELYATEDIRGTLEVVPSSRGAAGMREALIFSALASLWADGPRDGSEVITSARALADQAGISWSGQAGKGIIQALEILRLTGYRFVVEGGGRGRDRTFTLLSGLETAWEGSPTSPRRRIRVQFDPVVSSWLGDRQSIRPIDTTVLRALGPQRELARRLFLLLEVHGAGPMGDGREVINRLVDHRLAGSLGTQMELKKLTPALRRAGEAITMVAPRYEAVEVLPREKRNLERGEARYVLRAVRTRLAVAPRKKP